MGLSRGIKAQLNGSSLNAPHPTINSASVSYKLAGSAPQNNQQENKPRFLAIPQITVNIKPDLGTERIYLKIIDPDDKSVIYQVDYSVNSTAVTNNSGLKLFDKQNQSIFLSSGEPLVLKPYICELRTKNNGTELSTVFSITQ